MEEQLAKINDNVLRILTILESRNRNRNQNQNNRRDVPLRTERPPLVGGAPWTDEEVNNLLLELKQGLSWEEIAAAHKRSENAIRMRIGQYLGWRERKGDSVEDMSNGIGKTVEEIHELISKSNAMRRSRSRRV